MAAVVGRTAWLRAVGVSRRLRRVRLPAAAPARGAATAPPAPRFDVDDPEREFGATRAVCH
jgi:hypothetical protein